MKALLALGFRPFYLLAGVYAALGVPLWALQYTGWLPHANALWHAHEMLFGYAFAVIAGFLLTAVRNWTGGPTPSGWTLGGVAALWIAARATVCRTRSTRASARRSPSGWTRRRTARRSQPGSTSSFGPRQPGSSAAASARAAARAAP